MDDREIIDNRLDVLCYHSEFIRHLIKSHPINDKSVNQAYERMKLQFDLTCKDIEKHCAKEALKENGIE